MTADSYIGCFISVISKAEISYEGFLFHINPKNPPSDSGTDLQVISSPPVQSTPTLPNDPAIIIEPYYPHLTAAASIIPFASTAPATNISYIAQLGLPNSTFQGNLPLDQSGGSLGSWDPFPPPPSANGNGFVMPTYWSGHVGSSGGISHLQQQSSLQSPQSLPLSPQVQQQMQNPTINASLPSDTLSSAEFSHPMLPTVGTGPPSLISTMPTLPAFPLSVLIRQSSRLPSKLSTNLMLNSAYKGLATVTLDSDFPLASPLIASSLDVNPVLPPVMDKPKSVCQTISQSMPSIDGSSSPVHHEASVPPLLTPGQLLQPGLTGQSSHHFQTAHKYIEVVQASKSDHCHWIQKVLRILLSHFHRYLLTS